jgi:hypothetical protein
LLEGIEHVEGSMFESVPTGDAILLKVSEYREFIFKFKMTMWKKNPYLN